MENRKQISSIIGSYLKSLRMSRDNMSQAELSKRIGITAAYVGYIENALRLPSVKVVESYADFFDVPIDELLNLRQLTIFETVDLLGPETPLAIKNERNMILHTTNKSEQKALADHALKEEDDESLYQVSVKLTIDKQGNLSVDGAPVEIDKLGEYLKSLTPKK